MNTNTSINLKKKLQLKENLRIILKLCESQVSAHLV